MQENQKTWYDKDKVRFICMKLSRKSDADVLARLDSVRNKQGYIKGLIRADMRQQADAE